MSGLYKYKKIEPSNDFSGLTHKHKMSEEEWTETKKTTQNMLKKLKRSVKKNVE